MSSELYKAEHGENCYVVTKLDEDFNAVIDDGRVCQYHLANGNCNCPRGQTGKPCRHQKMLHVFINSSHIGDGYFLNYATKQWVPPVKDFNPENPIAAEVVFEEPSGLVKPEVSAQEPVLAARGTEQGTPLPSPSPPQIKPKPAQGKSWRRV